MKPLQRIMARVAIGTHGCWLWTGSVDVDGYARVWHRNGWRLAHRVVYELLVGPIPASLEIDHVRARGCLHRHCVNPAHLEAVTHRVNVARGAPATKTACVNGHAFDERNTYRRPDGTRQCRACNRAAQERRRTRMRDAA